MSEPTVSVIVNRIRSLIYEEPAVFEVIKDQVEKLILKIEDLESYLTRADEDKLLIKIANESEDAIDNFIYKVTSESRGSCSLLRRFLVEITYKSEDVIDNIIYMVTSESRRSRSFLKRYVRKPRTQIEHHQTQKIQGIVEKLLKLEGAVNSSGLSERTATAGYQQPRNWDARRRLSPPPSPSYPHCLVGLEKDINTLVKKMTRKDNHVNILYIVGPGVSGKSTLATELYHHPTIKHHFESAVWASASQQREAKGILLEILTQTQGTQEIPGGGTTELGDKVCRILEQRPYLIILDDVEDADLDTFMYPMIQRLSHRSKIVITTHATPSHLYNYKEYIVDPNEDVNSLVEKLTKKVHETGEEDQPSLFSITNFNYLGHKTSLARKLYDHPTVENHFEFKVWIPICKRWDATTTLCHTIRKTIKLHPSKKYNADLNLPKDDKELADILFDVLEEGMYLLVLDGMGDAQDLVDNLCAAQSRSRTHTRGEAHKSKIIITVDNPRVFRHSNLSCYLYTVRRLTENESWSLLSSIVISHAANSSTMKQLVAQYDRKSAEKGDIVKKCNGVALAVVALAGLLSTKETVEEWRSVGIALEKKQTAINEGLEEILSLSYYDLPSDITPCFLYLGLFQEHSVIPTGMLIRMWISEGIVTSVPQSSTEDALTLEDVATQYLEELASRCIIQVVKRNYIGEMKNIRLHDRIHRLSITKAAELGFLEKYPYKQIKGTPLLRANINSSDNFHQIREMLLRRAAIHSVNFNYPTKSSNLRSFIQLGKHGVSIKTTYFPHDTLSLSLDPIHQHFKLLRILVLCGIRTCDTLPEQIGDLIFLTYLGLRATNIQVLPETIRRLRRLVTLDYRGILDPSVCVHIPNVLLHMTALRHVYLPESAMSSMKNLDLSTLHNLQVLWGVHGGDWIMEDFGKLNSSLVKLGIINISSNEELEAVLQCLSNRPKQLRVLKLDWHRAEHGRLSFPKHLHNFEKLHKLALIGRLKENFTLLPSIVKLELFFSNLENDPTGKLGSLPQLKVLLLWNSYKGIRWTCGPNMFQKLEELQISHLPNLEQWRVDDGAMPHLKKLSIFYCKKLAGLPKGLRYLNLKQLEILNMPRSFCSRLQENKSETTTGGEDLKIIESIPYIRFEACYE